MNLHRSEKYPDWELTLPNQLNSWQKIAKKTNGYITPGNLVTATGAVLFLSGLRDAKKDKPYRAFAKIGLSRVADLLDGYVADKTKTKSSKGEAFDAITDSVETALILPFLVKNDYLPLRTAASFAIAKTINAATSGYAKKNNLEIHSSGIGKKAEAARWITVAMFAGQRIIENNTKFNAPKALNSSAILTETIASGLGALASVGYLRDINSSKIAHQNIAAQENPYL